MCFNTGAKTHPKGGKGDQQLPAKFKYKSMSSNPTSKAQAMAAMPLPLLSPLTDNAAGLSV